MGWYARRDLYDSVASSLATSGITSQVYNVEGLETFTIQIFGSTSSTTVQGTNVHGRTAVIAEADWSTISTVINGGMISIDPGFAWVRALRSDGTSTSRAILGGWQRSW